MDQSCCHVHFNFLVNLKMVEFFLILQVVGKALVGVFGSCMLTIDYKAGATAMFYLLCPWFPHQEMTQ